MELAYVVRVHVRVRVCPCVSECVRVCQARQVYRQGEFTNTFYLQNKTKDKTGKQNKTDKTEENKWIKLKKPQRPIF